MKEIRFDPVAKKFTFSEMVDGRHTESVRPMKYSPEDKYGKYRRAGKEMEEKNN